MSTPWTTRSRPSTTRTTKGQETSPASARSPCPTSVRTATSAPSRSWAPSPDNPAYTNRDGSYTPDGKAYMEKLDALTGVRRMRLRDGRWTAAENVIYEEYDETIHVVDPFPVPEEWPRLWSIDFGFTNPFVCQWWAIDPDGRLILYREIYMSRRTVDHHARDILDQVSIVDDSGERVWTEPRPIAVVCDHDAEGRAVLSRELDLNTTPAHKAVKTGLQAGKSRLLPAGDGRPRLLFMRDVLVERDEVLAEAKKPLCTVEEITGYPWAKPKESALSKPEPEEPVKVDDHGMDAMRYAVAELDLVGQGSVQSPARAPGKGPGRSSRAGARYGRSIGGGGGAAGKSAR